MGEKLFLKMYLKIIKHQCKKCKKIRESVMQCNFKSDEKSLKTMRELGFVCACGFKLVDLVDLVKLVAVDNYK